jgi:hypothetical protein
MTLLDIYNNRSNLKSVRVEGVGLVKLTGKSMLHGSFGPLIEVEHKGRKIWEQGYSVATAKARYKGTSPVPSIVAQMR